MNFKAIINFLGQYYERLIAVLAMLLLVIFAVWLMIRVNQLQASIGQEDAMLPKGTPVKPTDLNAIQEMLVRLESPPSWGTNSQHRLFIAPWMKVKPDDDPLVPKRYPPPWLIPGGLSAENIDKLWLRKYGFSTTEPVADLDPDGDGFTNREECEAKTDPTDPASHPDFSTKLRVVRLVQKPFGFLFTGNGEKAGKPIYILLRRDRSQQHFVEMDEIIPDKTFPGYKLIKYEQKSEKRSNPKIKDAEGKPIIEDVDVSELTLQKEGDPEVVLIKNVPAWKPGYSVLLQFLMDQKYHEVARGQTFSLQDSQYQVLSIKKLDDNRPEVIIHRTDAPDKPIPLKLLK